MTDTFIVDSSGEFVVGKAQTTPDDESRGFMDATRDALGYWEMKPDEARRAVEELRDAGVKGIVVNLLYSYRNSEHEDRIKEIAAELAPGVPVFLSSELYPMRRDFPRLNSTLIEAYAAEPSREQLQR